MASRIGLIYQELARRIGPERYREWLARLQYGNGQIGSSKRSASDRSSAKPVVDAVKGAGEWSAVELGPHISSKAVRPACEHRDHGKHKSVSRKLVEDALLRALVARTPSVPRNRGIAER